MTTNSELITILQALRNGVPVDYRRKTDRRWQTMRNSMTVNNADFEYRIAPSPRKHTEIDSSDIPPGTVFRWDSWVTCSDDMWAAILSASKDGFTVHIGTHSKVSFISYKAAMDGGEIWPPGAKGWKPCWKEEDQ